MFFEESRVMNVREMIVARTEEARREALAKLLPCQREDFVGIFEAMAGRPVTVRLLDPPLHEFLPATEEDIAHLAKDLKMEVQALRVIVENLKEFNPMLGHRGCRLGITFPEIYEMQVQAIFEAVGICQQDKGVPVRPEIMIPSSASRRSWRFWRPWSTLWAEESWRTGASQRSTRWAP